MISRCSHACVSACSISSRRRASARVMARSSSAQVDRLDEIVHGAALHAERGGVRVVHRGEHQDRDVRLLRDQRLDQVEAGCIREADVEQHAGDLAARDFSGRFSRALGGDHLVPDAGRGSAAANCGCSLRHRRPGSSSGCSQADSVETMCRPWPLRWPPKSRQSITPTLSAAPPRR